MSGETTGVLDTRVEQPRAVAVMYMHGRTRARPISVLWLCSDRLTDRQIDLHCFCLCACVTLLT